MEKGPQGTSFLLRISPYMEDNEVMKKWDFDYGVGHNAGTVDAPGPAVTEIKEFYCSTRRKGFRPTDDVMMPAKWWRGGGTDFGGCAGRHAAFTLKTGYKLCDATMHYDPDFVPEWNGNKVGDGESERWGIFGRVNVSTTFAEIRDGTSNTLMTGELQRLTDFTPGSKDGWAVGGPATLFTTGAMVHRDDKKLTMQDSSKDAALMNNSFWGSPGSSPQRRTSVWATAACGSFRRRLTRTSSRSWAAWPTTSRCRSIIDVQESNATAT